MDNIFVNTEVQSQAIKFIQMNALKFSTEAVPYKSLTDEKESH